MAGVCRQGSTGSYSVRHKGKTKGQRKNNKRIYDKENRGEQQLYYSSEQTDEIAREDVPAPLAPGLVEEFAGPPAVLGCGCDGDDIVRLEVELLVNRGIVVVQRFHIEQDRAPILGRRLWGLRRW